MREVAAVVMVGMLAVAAVACGSGSERGGTPSVARTSAPAATSTVAATVTTATASASASETASVQAATPAAEVATATPAPTGETGIDGLATIGPTCPVERADSPCPDRPYEARITIWQGTTMVAETRSDKSGRFLVLVPAGTYRVVGESGATFPHGVETQVTVVEGRLTLTTLRFDSGIR